MLFVNCVPLGLHDVVDLAEAMHDAGGALATGSGAKSYYGLDAFGRRDALASAAAELAESWRGRCVVALGSSPDFLAFLQAVRPHATVIVERAG